MAERFTPPALSWSPRGYLIYLLALPLVPAIVVSLYKGDAIRLVTEFLALALLCGGGWLVRRGLARGSRSARRRLATSGSSTSQRLGALAIAAAGLVCSHLLVGNSMLFASVVAGLAFAGVQLAYGIEARDTAARVPSSAGYTAEEIAGMLDQAEGKIIAIEQAGLALADRELAGRLERIASLARKVVASLEEDPRDIRRARKFLNVYLDGARRVSEAYVRTQPRAQSEELQARFRKVLETMEEVFGEQHRLLLENDLLDLDVQIEVLTTRLEREGVT